MISGVFMIYKIEKPVLGIVLPCFNEEEILPFSISKLKDKINYLINKNLICEKSFLLFVDDGSSDNTWSIIKKECQINSSIKGLKLSVNVGHQKALIAGLHNVTKRCDACISIDVDLQDDLNVIEEMIELFKSGQSIVLGVKNKTVSESFFKRNSAVLYYKVLKLCNVNVVPNHADFRLLSSRVLDNLSLFNEQGVFLRALPSFLHNDISTVNYDTVERFKGETKYTITKMMGLALNGITSFSITPLRIVTLIGAFISLFSFFISIYFLLIYFMDNTVQGWTTIVISIYLIGGFILFSIGILGEYLGKVFLEVKKRPLYLIDEKTNFDV